MLLELLWCSSEHSFKFQLADLSRTCVLVMAGNTHSLLFSNILLINHQSSTDAKRIFFSGTQKNCKHCSRSCAFPQSMILFFLVVHVFCVKFLCACVSVGAFCKADIYAKSKGEQLSTFSEKMHINDITFGQFFCTDKV